MSTNPSPLIGKYCIVRCTAAGVHAGLVVQHQGQEVLVADARRLWYWKPKVEKFLCGVALQGLDPASKVGAPVPERYLSEACEITPCTAEAEDSIRNSPIEKREV